MATQSPVCVIIAVRNVAAFLSETLDSLLAQTFRDWTAIIVDDGSTDSTAEIAAKFAAADTRIVLLRQSWKGVSAARNAGIDRAESEWLLFLDGDDTLAPQHLERMMSFAQTHLDVGAVHCGWARLREGQRLYGDEYAPDQADMFDSLAARPTFVIHACLVRRRAILDAGMFDEHLTCCVDWDVWQRVARLGTKFGSVREVLAFVRIRSGSVSSDMPSLLANGLSIIRRGQRERSTARAAGAELIFCCWCAGVLLGKGEDARRLLSEIPRGQNPGPAWIFLAKTLLHGIAFGSGYRTTELLPVFRRHGSLIHTFIQAMEEHVDAEELAWAVENEIAEAVLNEARGAEERIGAVQSTSLELTAPLHDIRPESGIERIVFHVFWRGTHIGEITLPVVAASVSREVLADAVAAKFAWKILGEYFKETVYRTGSNASDSNHDAIGWDVFLKEIWGTPHVKSDDFYRFSRLPLPRWRRRTRDMPSIEIAAELEKRPKNIGRPAVVTLGGSPLGVMPSSITRRIATAGDWIAAINLWSGFELCQTAVRDLLIGQPVEDGSLRDRLKRRREQSSRPVPAGATVEDQLMLGRRLSTITGTSASRRYTLPGSAADDLKALAERHKEPVKQYGTPSVPPGLLHYTPEFICSDVAVHAAEEISLAAQEAMPVQADSVPIRARFESLFARTKDPWDYSNEYEQVKYEQTASLLHGLRIERALELACAEGHFSVHLAPLVEHLTATDVSEIALSRARTRCAGHSNVVFQRLDFALDQIPSPQDLIVCSEALYYAGSRRQLENIAHKVAAALRNGGYFLSAHANLVVDAPHEPGFDWGHEFGAKTIEQVFRKVAGLKLVREIRTPLYRVQLFGKNPANFIATESAEGRMGKRPEHKASSIRWAGGEPTHRVKQASERLPILMYHSVAPAETGPGRMRITPEDFDRQIAFLKASGYYTVTLDQWRTAMFSRQPLPGNAIILTFDDGYIDFYEHAWPVLKKHGFSALVFAVTGSAGGNSSWSDGSVLMSWSQMRELQADGVQFGSHTDTHRSLRRLPFETAVKELAHSRVRLEDELSSRVSALAYPYGDTDECIEHFVGGCGYIYGLGIRDERSRFTDRLLDLPRINVDGTASFENFVGKLWDDYSG